MQTPLIEFVKDEIWWIKYPVHYSGLDFDARMTIIRVDDGSLMLHSPCEIDATLKRAINQLGPVSAVVAPGNFHYLHLESAKTAFPEATVWISAGLKSKKPNLEHDRVLEDKPDSSWENTFEQVEIQGNRFMNEMAFFHLPSLTLILVDAIENIGDQTPNTGPGLKFWWKRIFHMWNIPKPAPEYQLGWKDKLAAKSSLEKIMVWDFNRIIISHGDLIEANAKMIAAKAWETPLNASPSRHQQSR